eukprot:gene2274-2993_t
MSGCSAISLPNAALDIVAAPRACTTFELCPYVRNTHPFDVEGSPLSDEATDVLGILKGDYYTSVVSALPAGLNQAVYYWLASSTNLVGYVKDQKTGYALDAFAKFFFNAPVFPETGDVSTLGCSAYDKLLETLMPGYEKEAVKVGVPPAAATWAEGVCAELGLAAGQFVLAHGVPSDSAAAMSMAGDTAGSSLPLESWAEFAAAGSWYAYVVCSALQQSVLSALFGVSSSMPVLFATPREDASAAVAEAIPGAKVVIANNPSKLAALVSAAGKVASANTAAVPLAGYLSTPAAAAFSSYETGVTFTSAYTNVTAVSGADATGKGLADALN